MKHIYFLLIAALLGLAFLRALAAQTRPTAAGDEHWLPGFDLGAPDGRVSVVVTAPNGDLYIGGAFHYVGDVAAANIARWDGTRWHALGEGIAGDASWGSVVNAIAFWGNDVIVGGMFWHAGGVPANKIARWDGTAWHAMGNGIQAPVNQWPEPQVLALTVMDSSLYVGGRFTLADSVPANNIARWDGTAWSGLGNGFNMNGSVTSTTVQALATKGHHLIAAGQFTHTGSGRVDNVAEWDGTQWLPMGNGLYAGQNVNSLAVLGNALYAGGDFLNKVARWDGTTWTLVGNGINASYVTKLLAVGTELYAGVIESRVLPLQPYPVLRLDTGTDTWAPVGSSLTVDVNTLAVHGTDLLMGFNDPTTYHFGFLRYDGAHWAPFNSGLAGDVLATARRGADVYAGGDFWCRQPGTTSARHVARWDGTAWHALPGSQLNGPVRAMAVAANGDLYVGGDFTAVGAMVLNHIARWDGTQWYPVGAGVDAPVLALAVAGNTLYAGGQFTQAGGAPVVGLAQWDGTGWSAVGGSITQPFGREAVRAILVDGPALYVGGTFGQMGGVGISGLARWDGTRWDSVGHSRLSEVLALAKRGTELYVSSFETFPQMGLLGFLSRWDGTTWTSLASVEAGFDGTISTMTTTSTGDLLVGGTFTALDTVTQLQNLARWDGTAWQPVGSGTNGGVYTLATNGPLTYVGGAFGASGDGSRVMGYFGIYDAATVVTGGAAELAAATRLSLYPNPTPAGRIRLMGSSATTATIRDAAGREVRQAAIGFDGALDINGLPAGLYLVRVGSRTVRLVVE